MTLSRRKTISILMVVITTAMIGSLGWPRDAEAKSAHEVHPVVIENMKFNPERIEARVGDTIRWTNQDIVPHTATAENKSFDSKLIESGKSWQYVIKKKGQLPYVCSFHPTMKGLVVVK